MRGELICSTTVPSLRSDTEVLKNSPKVGSTNEGRRLNEGRRANEYFLMNEGRRAESLAAEFAADLGKLEILVLIRVGVRGLGGGLFGALRTRS